MKSKPILLLDQDGPLADFDQAFWEVCQDQGYEMDIDSLGSTDRRRFMSDNVVGKADQMASRVWVESPGWFSDLPETPGAIQGTYELMEHFDVWVCTKPLEANPNCRDEKAAWIRQYIPELEHKLILAPNKGMIKGDILLDDAPKPAWFQYAEWTPVLFPTPFNGEGTDWDGIASWTWGDPVSELLEIADKQQGENAR